MTSPDRSRRPNHSIIGQVCQEWSLDGSLPRRIRLPGGAVMVVGDAAGETGEVDALDITHAETSHGNISQVVHARSARYQGAAVSRIDSDRRPDAKAAAAAELRGGRGWSVLALCVAAIVCLPMLSVLWLAFNPEENIWPHLYDTVLMRYIANTILLMLGVAAGTSLIGVSAAWLITHYEFPGRGLFNWALLLPFAVPAYVIAYVYTDLLEFAGPVQSALRALFGWRLASDYWFPEIRSLPGAALMLVLVLYPYVYLLSRAAFLEQSASMLEAARALGVSRRDRFLRVALPMARPAIAVGLAMALMETLNDYGTVNYFAVRTLTAGLYDVWLRMNNLGGGAQIATLILVFVVVLIGLEKVSRRHRQNYQPSATRFRTLARRRLVGGPAFAASLACLLPVVLGFVIPAWVLTRYAITYFEVSWNADFREIALNSVLLSASAALTAVLVGLLLAYSQRLRPSTSLKGAVHVASLGYAVPGAVLAIGVIIPFATFDNALDAFLRRHFDVSTGLLLSGTVFALVFAYTVRFLAVAYGSIDASMRKISPHMDDAARSLGHSAFAILGRIHLPLMRSGVLTAALVVFVDCMKELPATLVLRPFNFDTLATHVFQYASDELIGQASLGALIIVLVGLAPVILLTHTIDRSRELRAAGIATVAPAAAVTANAAPTPAVSTDDTPVDHRANTSVRGVDPF